MYIDYLKSNYEGLNIDEKKIRVDRDKTHLSKLIREDVESDIENIVERWWSLDSTNSVFSETEFTILHKEAENHYYFGRYYSCIVLIGVAVEELCKSLVNKNNIDEYIKNQFERLNLLRKRKILSNEIYTQFNSIRKHRNGCVHYNAKYKTLGEDEIKEIAFNVFNDFRNCLCKLDYIEELDREDIDKLLIENNNLSFESFKLRQRNIDFEKTGIDLQINGGKSFIYNTSYFMVDELDIDSGKYNEVTLVDTQSGFMLIVDLTIPDINQIRKLNIEEGNIITASFISKVSSLGATEEWKLMEIHDVFRG